MPITKGCKQLVADARKKIRNLSVDEARARHGDEDAVFVDIRDIRELEREGMIPGAVHAPRGMLEFWVDPDSPYYREVFGSGKHFVLYCASGWRSSLAAAALQDMGMDRVSHLDGGFKAWRDAGLETESKERKGG